MATPEQTAAVEGAVRWLRAVAIHGKRCVGARNADGLDDAFIVEDPTAGPVWARFYEIGSNRPIFLGRDSIVRYSIGGHRDGTARRLRILRNVACIVARRHYPRSRKQLAASR